ncbi:hypothetical protein ES332_D13G057000v1 [Gossypium tomentosum]|uniref:Uncharacterized protein n=1 Tax=Gossypium tomentosum TaxID=34277 RepID=A0A5D2HT20_GOSTO|nr:hypothetical protein ES332_D13G057000v1 [Gossypium tomentosum]
MSETFYDLYIVVFHYLRLKIQLFSQKSGCICFPFFSVPLINDIHKIESNDNIFHVYGFMMIRCKACFSKHSQWLPESFCFSPGLRACAAFILPWMSETFYYIFIIVSLFKYKL